MTKQRVRRGSLSRRTMLAGGAGTLGAVLVANGAVRAQSAAPAAVSPGASAPGARYGDPAWWAQLKEEILEPGLAIIDPHHHLWDRDDHRYLLDQLLADTQSGHNIAQS